MDMQNVSSLQIPEGQVKTIHNKGKMLLWGKVNYSVKYVGNRAEDENTGTNLFDISKYSNAILRGAGGAVSLQRIGETTLRATNKISQTNNFCGIPVPNVTNLLGKTVTAKVKVKMQTTNRVKFALFWMTNTAVSSSIKASSAITSDGEYSITANIPSSIPSGMTQLGFVIYGSDSAQPVGSYVDWYDMQLCIGSAVPQYSPYNGGISTPTPVSPQSIEDVTGSKTIVITGKNLFDCNNAQILNAYIGADTLVSNAYNRTLYIPCEPNTTYTVTKGVTSSNPRNIGYCTTTPTVGGACSGVISAIPASQTSAVITTDYDSKYLVFTFMQTAQDGGIGNLQKILDSIQIEKSGVPTPFEAYQSGTHQINFGNLELCSIGTHADYIYKNNGSWYLHNEIKKLTLSSSQNWSFTSGDHQRFTLSGVDDIELQAYSVDSPKVVISNYFAGSNWASAYGTSVDDVITSHDSAHVIIVKSTRFSTLSDFTGFLDANNVVAYYASTSPTETIITDQNLIGQLEEVEQFLTRYGYEYATVGNVPVIINRESL